MHALIIDDVPLMRKIIENKLYKLGIKEVTATGDPEKAIADFRSFGKDIDLVIVDYKIPKMNGSAVLKQMESSPHYKSTTFAFISGYENLEKIVFREDLKVDFFMNKTNFMERFDEVIARVKEKKEKEEAKVGIEVLEEYLKSGEYQLAIENGKMILTTDSKKLTVELPEFMNVENFSSDVDKECG